MKVRIGFFLLVVILVLLSACNTSGLQNSDENNSPNMTREQAIQTIGTICDSAENVDINSNPEMDQVVDNVRYYFIQVVYANKMTAAYYVDEKAGNVFVAVGGELDTENPLPIENLSDQESKDASEATEIEVSVTTVIKDIFDTIGMTADQVEEKFGTNYKNISVNYDGYMEGFLYSDKGVTVAFGNDGTVTRVYCTDKIDVNGAKSGMNFSQIQEILGETGIRQTWAETPINSAYEIKYSLDGRTIAFFSRLKEGNDSIMSIS